MGELSASLLSRALGAASLVVDMLGVRDGIKGVRRDKRR